MKRVKLCRIAVLCLIFGFIATYSPAQSAPDELSVAALGAGADLVITDVHGPLMTSHNHTVYVSCTVKNQGTQTSGPYSVELYLSTDKTIKRSTDRLLDKVAVLKGLPPGERRTTAANVLVPTYGLSGDYYWGAIVGTRARASTNHVSLARCSLTDNNNTVTDHKTGYVWQRVDDREGRSLNGATQYCADLVLGGKSDWRLPRMDELETIVSWTRINPSIDPLFDCSAMYYWSSTTNYNQPEFAWYVNFSNGRADLDHTYLLNYVRCVRGGL